MFALAEDTTMLELCRMVAVHSPATLGLYYSTVKIAMLSCLDSNLSQV